MKLLSAIIPITAVVATVMALEAQAAAPTFTPIPVNGLISGSAGQTIGWGFTITNSMNYVLVTSVDFTPAPTVGTFTDFIAQFNTVVVGPAPESPVVSQIFDANAHTGTGSLTINNNAQPGDMAMGNIVVIYDLFSRSPNDPNFDPDTDTVSTGNTFSAAAKVTVTAIDQTPDLTVTKTHSGNFAQGQTGGQYTITVANSGAGPTLGAVTVADTLPIGLTATALGGTGWSCTLATLTCTRSGALAAGAGYPAITVTVNVASNAAATVTNTATVSGGGDVNTSNNTAMDSTTIAGRPDLTIAKTHAGSFFQGDTGKLYTITVANSGAASSSGTITVTDNVPASLTPTAAAGIGWTCSVASQAVTCSRSDALANNSSYPAIVVTVNVAANAPSQVANTATVSGGGEVNTGNNTATDQTFIIPDLPPPSPFTASPVMLPFRFVIGSPVPPPQTILVTSSSSGQGFTATTDAKWLAVSSNSTTTPATLTVSINPSDLPAGLYRGTIRIESQNAVQVNLTVLNPAPLVTSVSPSVILPGSNDTTVTVTGAGFLNGAVVQFSGNGVELPTTFIDASTLRIIVSRGLAATPAIYSLVAVNPQSAASRPFQVTIGTPPPSVSAVVNGASYTNLAIAPGEIISLLGTGLGPYTGVSLSLTPAGLVSTALSGVRVLFDGIPAPLIYVKADQVNAIVPYAIGGRPNTHVVVEYNGQTSAVPLTIPVAESAPALFTANASGKGQGAMLNQDGSVNSSSNPAAQGSVVVLYGTGEGATDPMGVDGKPAGEVLPKPKLPVSVQIDGQDAQVLYSGAAPGEVAGVIQVNVLLPDGVRSGAVPVVLQVGGVASQPGVTLSVQEKETPRNPISARPK